MSPESPVNLRSGRMLMYMHHSLSATVLASIICMSNNLSKVLLYIIHLANKNCKRCCVKSLNLMKNYLRKKVVIANAMMIIMSSTKAI